MSENAFGEELWAESIRAKRRRLCWTQNELARRLEQAADPKTRASLPSRASIVREIRYHESGSHRPGPVYEELYRRVWSAELSGPAAAAPEVSDDCLTLAWIVGRLNQRVDRRTLLQLAGTTAAGLSLDPVDRLVRALSGTHKPDETTIAHLEDRTRGLHRLEEHRPAKALYPAVLEHLKEVTVLLESGLSDENRRRLAVVAGESAVLAAWFAWEQGDRQPAVSHSRLATIAARHASDPEIAACMSGYRSFMTGGDTIKSIGSLQTALAGLSTSADPATRAWLLGRLAEESAKLKDTGTAKPAIQAAEAAYAAADVSARPWTCFLDPGRFASMRLTVHSRLRDEDEIVRAVDEIELYLGPETEVKKLCVVNAELALARYRLGDVNEAVECARSAFAATAELNAPLGWERLDTVFAEFASSPEQAARDFRSDYAASRPQGEQLSLH
ncbi:hypothetical protein GCM10022221_38920 [Actinocorallia aurea]